MLTLKTLEGLVDAVRDLRNETVALAMVLVDRGIIDTDHWQRTKTEVATRRMVNEAVDPVLQAQERAIEEMLRRLKERGQDGPTR
jgi:hypothetical protein